MISDAKIKTPVYIAVQLESADKQRRTWLPLPAVQEQFSDALEKIGAADGDFSISCYNGRLPAFGRCVLMENPLNKVNHLAARIQNLDDVQILKMCAIADSDMYFTDVNQYIDYTYNSGEYTLIPGVLDEEDLGRLYVYGSEIITRAKLKPCIDCREFGKRLAWLEDGKFTALGYITSNNGWGRNANSRPVPEPLNLKGYLGEDLYGDWDGNAL